MSQLPLVATAVLDPSQVPPGAISILTCTVTTSQGVPVDGAFCTLQWKLPGADWADSFFDPIKITESNGQASWLFAPGGPIGMQIGFRVRARYLSSEVLSNEVTMTLIAPIKTVQVILLSSDKTEALTDTSVTLTSRLTNTSGAPIPNKEILLQLKSGSTFSNIQALTTNSSGLAVFSQNVSGLTGSTKTFRVISVEDVDYAAAVSNEKTILIVALEAVDPKETLKGLLSNMVVNKDDGTTPATVSIVDSWEEQLLDADDVVVSIDKTGETDKPINVVQQRVVSSLYAIHVHSRDHTNVTATRIIWDVERQIKSVLGAVSNAPGGMLKYLTFMGSAPDRVVPGTSPLIKSLTVMVSTMRLTEKAGA